MSFHNGIDERTIGLEAVVDVAQGDVSGGGDLGRGRLFDTLAVHEFPPGLD
jgi:hypothetical protein